MKLNNFTIWIYYIYLTLFNEIKGKTRIFTENEIEPVYIKSDEKLTLICEQTKNYITSWMFQTSGSTTYLPISIYNDEFNITMYESHGKYINILSKARVMLEDSGSYKCIVESTIDTPYAIDVNVILMESKNGRIINYGNSTPLYCHISSYIKIVPKIYWTRNNSPLPPNLFGPNEKYLVETETVNGGYASVLHIFKAGEPDIGIYNCVCSLTNDLIFTQSIYLTSPPYIRIQEKSRTYTEGNDLTLDCPSTGWPPPKIYWQRANKILVHEGRIIIKNLGLLEGGTLVIKNITYKDRDFYTCSAVTVMDEGVEFRHNATIFVRVRGRYTILYPIIGLILEAIILFFIIFINNRRKKRAAD